MCKTIVITGSTRGLGYGMVKAFLERDCQVVVSSRSDDAVNKAIAVLGQHHPAERLLGYACDVRQKTAVESLWHAATDRFGRVDIWINNAGISNRQGLFWQLDADEVDAVIETNLLGSIYGCQVALRGMISQGQGAIYLMEGLGSDGRKMEGLAPYGISKSAVRYLAEALVAETRDLPPLVGSIQPGMVATELVTDQFKNRPDEWRRLQRILNIIADTVDHVAPWAVDAVLANNRHGARLTYLSRAGLLARFLTAPFHRRNVFAELHH